MARVLVLVVAVLALGGCKTSEPTAYDRCVMFYVGLHGEGERPFYEDYCHDPIYGDIWGVGET